MLITIDEKDLQRMIDERVEERLQRSNQPVYCKGWLELRKDITDYCHLTKYKQANRSFATLQSFIYSAIKFSLGISRLSEMSDAQAVIAREVFEFLKEKRDQSEWMS